jgi:hypothetical protein
VATCRPWPTRLPPHLALYVSAGLVWAATVWALPRIAPGRGQLAWVLGISLALRLPAWLSPPAHSDDLYRYLWDGKVQRAGMNPYRHPPDAPELAALRDADWARINNRHLPTIYPPGAELAFGLAAVLPLPSLVAWKLLAALADLGTLVLVIVWLRLRSGDPRRALAWGWSPLAAIELGQNAHMDGLGIALFVAALVLWDTRRPAWAGTLAGASAAVKLLGLTLLPALKPARARLACAAALLLFAAPYLGARAQMVGSIGEYGRRWRTNDGAFALLHAAAAAAVAHTRFAGRHDLGGSPQLARWITGRDRDQVYPDEVAGLSARAVAFGLFVLAMALGVHRRLPPLGLAQVAIGAFLLLTPTLHPWYVLWVVPLLPPCRDGSFAQVWLALAALQPLAYAPLAGWLTDGSWRDPIWTRALEHGSAWAFLLKAWTTGEGPVHSVNS